MRDSHSARSPGCFSATRGFFHVHDDVRSTSGWPFLKRQHQNSQALGGSRPRAAFFPRPSALFQQRTRRFSAARQQPTRTAQAQRKIQKARSARVGAGWSRPPRTMWEALQPQLGRAGPAGGAAHGEAPNGTNVAQWQGQQHQPLPSWRAELEPCSVPQKTKKWHDSARKWAQNRQHLRQDMGPAIGPSQRAPPAARVAHGREDFPRPQSQPISSRLCVDARLCPRNRDGGICSF